LATLRCRSAAIRVIEARILTERQEAAARLSDLGASARLARGLAAFAGRPVAC